MLAMAPNLKEALTPHHRVLLLNLIFHWIKLFPAVSGQKTLKQVEKMNGMSHGWNPPHALWESLLRCRKEQRGTWHTIVGLKHTADYMYNKGFFQGKTSCCNLFISESSTYCLTGVLKNVLLLQHLPPYWSRIQAVSHWWKCQPSLDRENSGLCLQLFPLLWQEGE